MSGSDYTIELQYETKTRQKSYRIELIIIYVCRNMNYNWKN